MTVKEFILKTVNTYVDLAVCEYKGSDLQRRIVQEKGKWHVSYIPEDLLNKSISSIVPYHDRIVLEVEYTQ